MIGSGFMARTYAECLKHYIEGAELRTVFGGRRAPHLAADFTIDCSRHLSDLLVREDIQAVIITTPEMVHREQTLQAAEAGKHVLVEKPMAPDVYQCDEMIKSCEKNGVLLQVVQSQRFRGAHRILHQMLNEDRIGAVQQIRHWVLHPLKQAEYLIQTRPFYLDPAGGGLFMGYTVHSFDMIRWLVGAEASTVYGNVSSYSNHNFIDLSMMAQVNFENDVVAQVWWSAELPGVTFPGSFFRTQLVGTRGLIDCDGYGAIKIATGENWQKIWEQPQFNLEDPTDPVRLQAFSEMIQEFVDAIQENRSPLVTGTDGRAAVELCQAVLESSRSGEVIRLPR